MANTSISCQQLWFTCVDLSDQSFVFEGNFVVAGVVTLALCRQSRFFLSRSRSSLLAQLRYWYQYSSFVQFPHVVTFSSIPDLLHKLVTVDVVETSAQMKDFNDRSFVTSVAFWQGAALKLLRGNQGCRGG